MSRAAHTKLMNTGLALTGRPDFLFQHFFPAHNAHLAVVDLDAIDQRSQVGLAERDLASR